MTASGWEAAAALASTNKMRSSDKFNSLMAIIDRNIAGKLEPLTKRQLTEAHLMAQYAAERDEAKQPAVRVPLTFQLTPHESPTAVPSLFSPATNKTYASPSSSATESPARQSALLSQQPSRLMRSPIRSPASTPLHNR